MKNSQQGFLGILTIIIAALILAGGTYVYVENKAGNSSSTEIQQVVNNEQNTNFENTENASTKSSHILDEGEVVQLGVIPGTSQPFEVDVQMRKDSDEGDVPALVVTPETHETMMTIMKSNEPYIRKLIRTTVTTKMSVQLRWATENTPDHQFCVTAKKSLEDIFNEDIANDDMGFGLTLADYGFYNISCKDSIDGYILTIPVQEDNGTIVYACMSKHGRQAIIGTPDFNTYTCI